MTDVEYEDLTNRFAYHRPRDEQIAERCAEVRHECLIVARAFENALPDCREKSLAVTKTEEAMMWAIAAIVRNQDDLTP